MEVLGVGWWAETAANSLVNARHNPRLKRPEPSTTRANSLIYTLGDRDGATHPPQHRTIPAKRTHPAPASCTPPPPATRNGALPPNALNSPDASNSGNIPVWILHFRTYTVY